MANESQAMRLFQNKNLRCLIVLLIGLALAFGLQPTNGLTPEGVRAIAVVVTVLLLWITVNTTWSCLLLFALLIATDVMTPGAVWSGSMGHFAPTLVLVFFLLAQCLNDTGAIDRVAAWFITRPFVKGRPYMFMTMFFFSNLFIGLFMQNLALTLIYINLTVKVCDRIGVPKGHTLYTCLILGILWVDSVVSIASPIAKTLPNIMIGSLYTQLGITVTYAQWLMVGIPFSIVTLGAIMLACRFAVNPDTSPLKDLDIEAFARNAPPLTPQGKAALITMGVLMLFILLPDVFMTIGLLVPLSSYFVRLSATVPAIIAVVFLCLFKVKGESVMDFQQAAKGVPINMVIFIAAVVLLGVPISDEGNGIILWIGNNLQPLVAGFSPTQIVIVLITGALIVTNFISSAVTLVLFFNIGVALLAGTGMNMGAFGVIVAFSAAMSCLTPAASLTMPLFFEPGHLTMQNTYKPNLISIVLAFIKLVAFVPLVMWIIRV